MKFDYVKLGIARFVDTDGTAHPIEGNYIYGVRMVNADGSRGRVLGLAQQNPASGIYPGAVIPTEWRAVASHSDGVFPAVDFDRGLWDMTPGRSGFKDRRTASLWLLGASDARQAWFTEAQD